MDTEDRRYIISHIWDDDDDDWDDDDWDIIEDDWDDEDYHPIRYCEACGSPTCPTCGEYTCFGCSCDEQDIDNSTDDE